MGINVNIEKGSGTVEKSALKMRNFGQDAPLPVASSDTLGGVKVGEGLSINESGVLSASGGGLFEPISFSSTISDVDEIIQNGKIPVLVAVTGQNALNDYYYLSNYVNDPEELGHQATFERIYIQPQANYSTLNVAERRLSESGWTNYNWSKNNN